MSSCQCLTSVCKIVNQRMNFKWYGMQWSTSLNAKIIVGWEICISWTISGVHGWIKAHFFAIFLSSQKSENTHNV